jgi:arginase
MKPMMRDSDKLQRGAVVVVGVGYDENSSFMQGPASAPSKIREMLHCGSANLCAENGIDLTEHPQFKDLGDIRTDEVVDVFNEIEDTVRMLVEKGLYVLALGGDHSITFPVVRGYRHQHNRLNILHLDAHPDLYDEYDGNRNSNACPFARIMEEGLADRLVQVGIRTRNPHQAAQAERFGVEMMEMRNWNPQTGIDFNGPVYLSLDLDVLDPGFAPGVSHHEPGGMSPRDVLNIIQGLKVPIVGADIVELNPKRDHTGVSAMVAAKFLKEIAGKMIELNP